MRSPFEFLDQLNVLEVVRPEEFPEPFVRKEHRDPESEAPAPDGGPFKWNCRCFRVHLKDLREFDQLEVLFTMQLIELPQLQYSCTSRKGYHHHFIGVEVPHDASKPVPVAFGYSWPCLRPNNVTAHGRSPLVCGLKLYFHNNLFMEYRQKGLAWAA